MENKTYRDTTHKLVHGHEGWLEDYISHYHAGDPIMAMLKWGHNCENDGLPKMDQLTYHVCAPDGTISDVKVELGGENFFDLTADTNQEGFYTFITKYNNCWAKYGEADEDYKLGDRTQHPDAEEVHNYCQYATICVSVGHHHETEMYQIPGMEISILPTTGPDYQHGHNVTFQLLVKGKPAANHEVLLVHLGDDQLTETTVTTDDSGMVSVCPQEKGTYCMIARALDHTADPDGKFEATNYTATHCFRITEHHHHHH